MSPEFYKVVHILGILLLFCSLGGLAMLAWQTRGAGAIKEEITAARKRLMMLHGLGLLLVFVAGFGLMAKLGLMKTWPLWILAKLAIWLFFGAAPVLLKRMAEHGKLWIGILPLVGALAAYLAVFHPG